MSCSVIAPGSTIGILGGGQLGRMLAMAARRMGYRVHVYSPASCTPASQVFDLEISRPYEDLDAARAFARGVDVVTFEFENVPAVTVEAIADLVPVRPTARILHTTQNRIREKQFLQREGLPLARFHEVRTSEDLWRGIENVGRPEIGRAHV